MKEMGVTTISNFTACYSNLVAKIPLLTRSCFPYFSFSGYYSFYLSSLIACLHHSQFFQLFNLVFVTGNDFSLSPSLSLFRLKYAHD